MIIKSLAYRKEYNKACNKECTKKIQKNTIYQVDRMILLSYNLIKKIVIITNLSRDY